MTREEIEKPRSADLSNRERFTRAGSSSAFRSDESRLRAIVANEVLASQWNVNRDAS
jgi:hypothetical protein